MIFEIVHQNNFRNTKKNENIFLKIIPPIKEHFEIFFVIPGTNVPSSGILLEKKSANLDQCT